MESEVKTVTVDVADAFAIKSDTGELCRLCANTDNQLMPIFRGEGLEHSIATKIEKYLPIINVTELDKLPLQICYQCASTLIAWNNLYEGCRVADKRLREILCIDDKLYPEDETFEDYVDDYRDNYDEQTHNIPTPTPSTSNLESNILRPDATDITQLNDAKTFNETELDSTDERSTGEKIVDVMNTTNSTTDQVVNSAPTTRQKGGDEIAAELITRVIESSEGELSTTTAAAPVSKASVKKTYVCVCCSKVYGSREGRRKHMRKFHNEDEPYPVTMAVPAESVTRDVVIDLISECDAAVVVKVEADSVDESENALSSANTCVASSPARFTYPRKRPRPYSCEVCAKTFLNFDGWRRHKLAHTDKYAMMSKCQVCDTQFASPYTMRRHRVQVHKISYFDENSSLYGSGNNSKAEDELIESVRTVIDGKKCLKCDQCEYSCELPSRFLEHYRRHTGERPFTCDQCGKQFRVRKFLKNHFKFVHEGVKAFECDICGRRFSDKRYTMSHRRIHTGEKPFVCDICGCAFAQNASLSVHKDRHAKVAKYKCPLCSKMFLYRGSMNLHVKRHYGQLSHQCDTCGKKFIDKKHLLRHVVVHSDERPFTCDVCGATFKLQKYLTQHMKVHRAK